MPLITTADGIELFYESFGHTSGPPLLLIQGLGAHMLGWHPEFCAQLADNGFHVIRFDNRDAGLSQKFPAQAYGLADMASDTAGLIRALGLNSTHVVGQSMGGMIAQRVVIDYPELVASLSLIYTAADAAHFAGLDLVESRMEVPQPRSRDEAIEFYLANEEPCASPGYPTDVEWLKELGGLMYDREPNSEGVFRQFAAIESAPDRVEELRQVSVPTAIVVGDSDRLIDYTASDVLHDAIPCSTLTVFPGMGHSLPRALWGEIIGLIRDNAALSSTTVSSLSVPR